MVLFTIVYVILYNNRDSWWYDVLIAYPFGVAYSYNKERIEYLVKGHYAILLILCTLVLAVLLNVPYSVKGLISELTALAFAFEVILLSMKVSFNNKVLIWLGANLFPLYIYQRIGMILFSSILDGIIIKSYPLVYMILCILTTLLWAFIFRYIQIKLVK